MTFTDLHLKVSQFKEQPMVTPETIRDHCTSFFCITQDDFQSVARNKNIVKARQFFSCLCRKLTRLSLSDIGSYMGKRDHSTVIHQINTLNDEMLIYSDMKRIFEKLERNIEKGIMTAESINDFAEPKAPKKNKLATEYYEEVEIVLTKTEDEPAPYIHTPDKLFGYNRENYMRAKYGI